MKKEFSVFLDMCRWLAALVVVIGHVRHIVLVDYGDVQHKNIFIQALYFMSGLSHEAVVVFFVLSGFLVGGITLKRWKTKGVDFADYFAHRISRIYIVLVPALIVGFACDYFGYHFFNATELYTNPALHPTNSITMTVYNNLSLKSFLGSLIMVENISVPILGSNGPLWTLVYEWWYYCIAAALLGAVLLRGKKAGWICALVLLAMIAYLPWALLLWMLIWLLGMATFFYCESSLPKPPLLLSLGLFIATLVLSRYNTHTIATHGEGSMITSFLYDFAIGVGFVSLLASFYRYGKPLPFISAHKKLADFSYSLYLLHFPLMVFFVAALHDVFSLPFLGQPDGLHLAYFLALTAILCLCSFLFALCTEAHTSRLKAWLSGRFRA